MNQKTVLRTIILVTLVTGIITFSLVFLADRLGQPTTGVAAILFGLLIPGVAWVNGFKVSRRNTQIMLGNGLMACVSSGIILSQLSRLPALPAATVGIQFASVFYHLGFILVLVLYEDPF